MSMEKGRGCDRQQLLYLRILGSKMGGMEGKYPWQKLII